MNVDLDIKDFALKNNRKFRLEELLVSLFNSKVEYSLMSVHNAIQKMVAKKQLVKVGGDAYEIAESQKKVFRTEASLAEKKLYSFLKQNFPFAQLCAWNVKELAYFTQHVPTVNFVIVEAEKDVVDAIADRLNEPDKRIVLKNPSLETMEYFSSSKKIIVVKNLVSQGPLDKTDELNAPRLEKILVDILCDDEFYFLRGMETVYVYQKAFDLYDINVKALKRYAGRRNKLKEVESLLANIA